MMKETTAGQKNAYLIQIKEMHTEFTRFVLNRLGIVVQHKGDDLTQTILQACEKFQCTPREYLNLLTGAGDDSPWLEYLVQGITIGETYFFRDKNQMQLLQSTILPELIKRKRDECNLNLRIWSAGCSSGEEIYTIGIMLTELIPDLSRWTIQLLGTDINSKVLQKAMNADYTEWSMRSISAKHKEHYFSLRGNIYQLHQDIKNLVNFNYLNLNDDRYPSIFNGTNALDLIICRNVFIYFDNSQIDIFMKKFHNCLVPGGYLLLGASDPIQTENTQLIFHHHKGALFSRPKNEFDKTVFPSTPTTTSIPVPIKKIVAPLKSIPRYEQLVPKKNDADSQAQIKKLLNESRWSEVIALIAKLPSTHHTTSFILNAQAMSHANLGKLDVALSLCKKAIEKDSMNKYLHFTLALTYTELNQLEDAEKSFRKTIFIDHQFVVGHYQLGLLLIRNKQFAAGMKSLNNALKITKTQQPNACVSGTQGLTFGLLTQILEHEIALYNP